MNLKGVFSILFPVGSCCCVAMLPSTWTSPSRRFLEKKSPPAFLIPVAGQGMSSPEIGNVGRWLSDL